MTDLLEHRALDRLAEFEQRLAVDIRPSPLKQAAPVAPVAPGVRTAPVRRAPMGHQPALDGLRGISVLAVILYHAGFGWMHGGFLGVEVFFVVSGFLITSLLLEEHDRDGAVGFAHFWLRRGRRLLPALFTMLIVVGAWAAMFGSARQQSDMRGDLLPGVFYVANWGQIVGGAQYFGNFSPLRHLWSLAVEEQWYLLWPLAFVWLMRRNRRRVETGRSILVAAGAVMIVTWWLASDAVLTADRVNLLYLSTLTRSSGLLLGAGAAFLWRPWQAKKRAPGAAGTALNVVGLGAAALLLYAFTHAHLTDRSLYRWQLAAVSLLSLLVVAAVVHPAAGAARAVFGSPSLVAIGQRSYGLYLWSWPISVFCGAYSGSVTRFVIAMSVTVVASEFCYQYVETPIRSGALREWFARARDSEWSAHTFGGSIAIVAVIIALAVYYRGVATFDQAAGGDDVSIDLAAVQPPVAAAVDLSAGAAATGSTTPIVAVAAPPVAAGPRRVVIVGDSQAHSLAINLPKGIGDTFTIRDGSVDGCGVHDQGAVKTSLAGFRRSFADCAGLAAKWGKAASRSEAQVALVVLGAWDVFDLEVDGKLVAFGTPAGDQLFTRQLSVGIDALRQAGAKVALLEVACMRPQSVKGAYVPPLPERGDDQRVAHLNSLLRQVASADPANVSFVSGPPQWCDDPAIASDLGYRWDGVHVYKPGAKLIYEAIAPALLSLPVT